MTCVIFFKVTLTIAVSARIFFVFKLPCGQVVTAFLNCLNNIKKITIIFCLISCQVGNRTVGFQSPGAIELFLVPASAPRLV